MVKFNEQGQGYFDFNVMSIEEISKELRNVNIERDIIRLDVDAKRIENGIESVEYLNSLEFFNKHWDILSFKKYLLCKELVNRGQVQYINVFNEIARVIEND